MSIYGPGGAGGGGGGMGGDMGRRPPPKERHMTPKGQMSGGNAQPAIFCLPPRESGCRCCCYYRCPIMIVHVNFTTSWLVSVVGETTSIDAEHASTTGS
jgi:hypothetical protein